MIFLNKEKEQIISIDEDLVLNYKHEGDLFLVSIHHELTKQLISYLIYYDLQQVDNDFFKIIKNLIEGNYTDISQLRNQYSEFTKSCNTFLKGCENIENENVYNSVSKSIEGLKLCVQKLIYIVENFCYLEED